MRFKTLLVMGGIYFVGLLSLFSFNLYAYLTSSDSELEFLVLLPFIFVLLLFWIKTFPALIKYSSKAFSGILDYQVSTSDDDEAEIKISPAFAFLAMASLILGVLFGIMGIFILLTEASEIYNRDWVWIGTMTGIVILLFNFFLYPLLVLNYFKVNEQ